MRKILLTLILCLLIPSFCYGAYGGWDSGRISANLFSLGNYQGVSDDCETGTTSLPAQYSYVQAYVTTRTLTVGNGIPGQVMTIIGKASTDTGTLTLDAST